MCFLPKHGDRTCTCASCTLYQIVMQKHREGFIIEDWQPNENF